jgi:hypothetical protein
VRESVQSIKDAPFDFTAAAELFPCRYIKNKRPIGYKRFDTAAEAVRFAAEELPAPLLKGTFLEWMTNALREALFAHFTKERIIHSVAPCETMKTRRKNEREE